MSNELERIFLSVYPEEAIHYKKVRDDFVTDIAMCLALRETEMKKKTLADYAEKMYLLLVEYDKAVQASWADNDQLTYWIDKCDHDREVLFCDIKANVDLKKYERSEE